MLERHYRRRDVEIATGLSRSSIYAMMGRGEFPHPVRIAGRAVAWPESVITKWLGDRPSARE